MSTLWRCRERKRCVVGTKEHYGPTTFSNQNVHNSLIRDEGSKRHTHILVMSCVVVFFDPVDSLLAIYSLIPMYAVDFMGRKIGRHGRLSVHHSIWWWMQSFVSFETLQGSDDSLLGPVVRFHVSRIVWYGVSRESSSMYVISTIVI